MLSPPQRGGTLSNCVCQQWKASWGGICLTGTTRTSLPPLSLVFQAVGRQSIFLTITFILLRFCCRFTLTHSDYKICKQLKPTHSTSFVFRCRVPMLNTQTKITHLIANRVFLQSCMRYSIQTKNYHDL